MRRPFSHRSLSRPFFALVLGALVTTAPLGVASRASAVTIPEPDAVFYGSASKGGVAVGAGAVITAKRAGDNAVVGTVALEAGAPAYVLKVNLASATVSGETKPADAAVIGQGSTLSFYVDGILCTGSVEVTERGWIQQRDLACSGSGVNAKCGDGSINQPTEQCDAGSVLNGSASSCCKADCKLRTSGVCEDGLECTTSFCNLLGQCESIPALAGTVCGDDGNPCTTDQCGVGGVCSHPAKLNGTNCADGTFCNGVESCQSGVCTAGTPPCDSASCNETADTCASGCFDFPGDCNGSNSVTTADVTCAINRIFESAAQVDACEDCNDSGGMSTSDVTCIVQCLFGNCRQP